MRIALLRALPFLALLAFALAGCQSDDEAAANAIEAYLGAKANANLEELTRLSCTDWEAQAQIEATSFASMDAQLDNVACTVSGAAGDYTLVSCTGQIVTTYQGENRTWPVSDQTYRALNDGGEWRMCGYGE